MEQTIPSLEREKDRTEMVLENLVDRVDTTLEKADTLIIDTEVSEKIQEKQEEIQELLEEVRVSLEDAWNKTEIKEILEETKDIITLKTSAALTPTADITEDPNLLKLSNSEKAYAEETLLSSLDSWEKNTIMIRSRSREDVIREKLTKYDETLMMDLQFEEDGYKVYEVSISKESLLSEELLENLDAGEVPESVLGIEIIRPELLQIGTIDFTGEDRAKLWWIEKYGTADYLQSLKQKSELLSRKIRVGIIDTGIESTHKDLVWQINTSLGYDFVNEDSDPTDDQWHGTHVAGTIAGKINGGWVFGVNPYVELVGLKICDNKGFCPSYSVLKALSYAKENNFDVLNMSLGARGNPEASPICSAVKDITAGGTIVVAAAGNSNVDTSTFVPGGCTSAITVAAVDSMFNRASFSNYGSKVDVAAPWVSIYSSYLANGHKSMNGTSMATPHIVGIVSIIKTYQSDISTTGIKKLFLQYTIPVKTDAQKPIGYFTDLNALISSFTQGKTSEIKKPNTEDIKQPTSTGTTLNNTGALEKPAPITPPVQTGALDQPSADIATIDESIGLMIQEKLSWVEVNSAQDTSALLVWTGSSDAVEINSADEDETLSSTLLEGTPTTNTITSPEWVEINSADDSSIPSGESIDFDNIDKTHASIISTTDGGVEINSADDEREEIVIDPEWAAPVSDWVQINSNDDEEQFIELPVISESTALSQQTPKKTSGEEWVEINSALYCTIYTGWSCGYNLNNALAYNYATSIVWGVQLSIWSNWFTVYGRQPGTSIVYIYSRGTLVHTITVNVQSPLRSLSAQIGTYTLLPGYSTWFQITDGNGGYSVTSSNPSVIWVSGAGTNYTFTAKSSGTATITYRDQKGYYGSFTMTVTTPPRAIQANVSSWSTEVAKTITLTITDGNGGYSVTSSNPSIATVSNTSSTVFTITGKSPGTSRIVIRDSRGQSVSGDITITAPARILRYTYWATTLNIWSSSRISISDGNGGYSVTSSNPAIASVSGSNTEWSIVGKSAGTTTITVRDQRGYYGQLKYTILAPLRSLRATIWTTNFIKGDSTLLNITDGNGGYTVTSSNPNIISVTRKNPASDTQWTLQALSAGESTITLRDARWLSGWVKITVKSNELILDKTTLTVEVWQDAYFRVNSGNGWYSHAMNNGNIGWYFDNPTIPSYRVRGVTPGTTILQIRDSTGKVAQVVVTIVAKKDTASITDLQFSPSIRDGGMWGIYFEVLWDYKEVWLEYHYGDKLQPIVERFSREADNLYAAVYVLECSDRVTCKVHLKPYIIDTNGKKVYHTNYNGTNFIAVWYDRSGTSIANADEGWDTASWVEINWLKEINAYFKQVWVSIKRTAIEYRWVYDGSADALSDQLEELKSLLDSETYKQVAREIKKLVTTIVNGNYDVKVYLQKFKVEFAELYGTLELAYSYLDNLTSYQKQYYGSYLSVSSAISFIWPGKLKWTKALKKVEDKAKEVIEKGIVAKMAKITLSLDAKQLQHIKNRHLIWWSEYIAWKTSYFYSNQNIEWLIKKFSTQWWQEAKEGRFSVTKTFPENIGYDRGSWKDTNVMTLIFNSDGSIITAHPWYPTN
jgi:hypothetical protein